MVSSAKSTSRQPRAVMLAITVNDESSGVNAMPNRDAAVPAPSGEGGYAMILT